MPGTTFAQTYSDAHVTWTPQLAPVVPPAATYGGNPHHSAYLKAPWKDVFRKTLSKKLFGMDAELREVLHRSRRPDECVDDHAPEDERECDEIIGVPTL